MDNQTGLKDHFIEDLKAQCGTDDLDGHFGIENLESYFEDTMDDEDYDHEVEPKQHRLKDYFDKKIDPFLERSGFYLVGLVAQISAPALLLASAHTFISLNDSKKERLELQERLESPECAEQISRVEHVCEVETEFYLPKGPE